MNERKNERIEWLPDIKLWQIQRLHHHLIESSLEEDKKNHWNIGWTNNKSSGQTHQKSFSLSRYILQLHYITQFICLEKKVNKKGVALGEYDFIS